MKHTTWIPITALLVITVVALAGDRAYTGLKKCKMCHKGEAKGSIFETWEASSHAQAFVVLGEDKAKEVHSKAGKEGNPQEDPDCLKCHVTGYSEADSLTVKIVKENGVTCESCHGAGGDYWKKPVMTDHEQSLANGLNPDPKTSCVKCHNEESPNYKEFIFEDQWEKIKHPLPE